GEWSKFGDDFREDLIRSSVDIVGNRLEILAGIHSTGLNLTLKNMERVADVNCDSYVLTLPCKTSRLDPMNYIMTVLNASDKPVYYYHCPPNNGINLSRDHFEEIVNHPKLKGIKNSAGDMGLRKELIMLKDK
ncbi:MAG: dihydrodipicolinate synthase family protein, partial [Bacteroidales bacterium]|nr:dihydrodipicolinate synthase family protein [Bacteroidales bacterium]